LRDERRWRTLRPYDLATGQLSPMPAERIEQAGAENERLRRELAELRRSNDAGK
jgi:hypothetical protein